jgi:hypothetical protein
MAFVALKTAAGNRAVCFRHYMQLDEVSVHLDNPRASSPN